MSHCWMLDGTVGGGLRWLLARFAMLAVCGAWAIAGSARGSVVASWNMNGVDPLQTTVLNAASGTGWLDFGGLGSTASVLQGTTLGALKGEAAGDALAAIGTLANGTSMRVDFETIGYRDLSVSFATRRSATGASVNRLEYWDGMAWVTALQFASNSAAWELLTVKLAGADELEDGIASLRFVIDGATSASGSLRFDNLVVTGTATPAPGALALLGLAGCVSRRRR